jgi:hypothetical protein
MEFPEAERNRVAHDMYGVPAIGKPKGELRGDDTASPVAGIADDRDLHVK